MSLKLSSTLILLTYGSIGSICNASENSVYVPDCPKTIKIEDHQPKVPNGWQVSLASRYIDYPDKYRLKNGVYETTAVAPQVSYIHHDRSQKVRALSPEEEEFFELEEQYSWVLNDKEDWVFFCDVDDKIFIYQPVPKEVKKCLLTIHLENGARSWSGQTLKCNK